MLRTTTLLLCLLLASSGDLACSGNDPATTATSPQSAGIPATDKNVGQVTANSPGEGPRFSKIPAGQSPHAGPIPGPLDPPWFKPELFPGATVSSSGRTQKDEQGLFSTQILLALPAGTTREACVEALQAAVATAVPTITQEPGKDDRVTLTGSNGDYHVTMVCGAAKGTMNAYVSYRWLRPPG